MQYQIILNLIKFYYIILYYVILYYIILYYIILYYSIVQSSIVQSSLVQSSLVQYSTLQHVISYRGAGGVPRARRGRGESGHVRERERLQVVPHRLHYIILHYIILYYLITVLYIMVYYIIRFLCGFDSAFLWVRDRRLLVDVFAARRKIHFICL